MMNLLKKRETLFNILSLVLSIASMAIVFSLIGRVAKDDLSSAAIFLGIAFLCEAGYNFSLFVKYEDKKERIRLSIGAILFIVAAILGFISNDNIIGLFSVSSAIFLFSLAVNRFLSIKKTKEAKWNVTNFLLGILFLLLIPAIFYKFTEFTSTKNIILFIAFILLFKAFIKLIWPTFRFEKVKVLLNILNVTHTLDILICLLALMISFSFIFPMFEPNITNFWDGLWYCFAVITTIDFGDFYATTTVGRILTVILGLYGIVIVAILTSVIVNFYNEITDKNTEKKVNKLVKEYVENQENENKDIKEVKPNKEVKPIKEVKETKTTKEVKPRKKKTE